MKPKQFVLEHSVTVSVYKRAKSRRISLSIGSDGQVKLSIPQWLPYKAATDFALTKLDWIKSKQPAKVILVNNQQIGKSHRLIFKLTDKASITTRLANQEAIVYYPRSLNYTDPAVQVGARRVIRRALTLEASNLLPIRLAQLAKKYGYNYSSVKVKALKTRWGSCDHKTNITLNIYLMQLPWNLIDYVLLHELNHTKVMRHGSPFWDSLALKLPAYKDLKKQLRAHPIIV